jgi:hypothetical protein
VNRKFNQNNKYYRIIKESILRHFNFISNYVIPVNAGICYYPHQYILSGDSCIRRNDKSCEYVHSIRNTYFNFPTISFNNIVN